MDNEENAYQLIDKYSKQIESALQLDASNVFEKQLSAPNLKHEWLFKLVRARMQLIQFGEDKENIIYNKFNNNPMGLSKAALKMNAEKDDDVNSLNRKIKKQELLVDYLDAAVNKIFSQLGFDFKNLVELMKMEQL